MARTVVSDLSTVQAAYNLLADMALRPMLYFDQVATVKPTAQSHVGSSVVFPFWDDLAAATGTLTENSDLTPVNLSDSTVTVSLAEYGNVAGRTALAKGTSYLASSIDTDLAEKIGWNAGLSQDTLALNALKAGTNVIYAGSGSARNTVIPTDTLGGAKIREAVARLRGDNVMGMNGMTYVGYVHPDVSYDLRATDTDFDNTAIRNEEGARVWNGYIGRFQGVDFVETSTAPIWADAGSSTTLTDVYGTLIVGKQALAKAYSSAVSAERAEVRVSPTTDYLSRFFHVGWYWLGGYARYREEAIRRIESASSIGTNA